MAIQFYNTRTRTKEVFTSLLLGKVHMYNCGPTVYNYAHIGNFRAFVTADVLRRYLEYKGFSVLQVMNITDVDDKIIRDAQQTGEHWRLLTERYTAAFFEDLDTLHIKRATHYPKATDHIDEIVAMIQQLLVKGVAYKTDDGIYFNIAAFHNYGKLSGVDFDHMKTGNRVAADEYDKEHARDFALWKFWRDGPVFWETSLGKGRPGWHIECSAMSIKYLGEQFDIHTGGVDLIFPHHENEIAQTESATAKSPFVAYWLHNDYILVDGKKMSKRLGNFYTLRDLLTKGYKPMAIRYVLLSSNYRQQLNFTLSGLDGAANAVQRYQDFYDRMKNIHGTADENIDVEVLLADTRLKFENAMDNDLETSPALAAVFDFIHAINKLEVEGKLDKDDAAKIVAFIEDIDSVLGLLADKESVPADVLYLVQQREEARKEKNWKKADELRDEIRSHGYLVEDGKKKFIVKKC